MHRLLAAWGTVAFVAAAAPAVQASPVPPDRIVEALADGALAYVKQGGKGWKHGKKAKGRGGPPPWAPAYGYRRKYGY